MRSRLATSAEWRSVVSATLEAMNVGGWELDLRTGAVWWSENLGPLVGRPRGFVPADFSEAQLLFERPDANPLTLDEAVELYGSQERGESERKARLPDGRTRWTRHQYSVSRDEQGRPSHVFGLVTDIEDSRRRADEERFLGEASRTLGASLDIEETLAAVAHLLVPSVADWCVVELVGDGTLEPVVVAHTDPDRVRWAEEIRARYPTDMSAATGPASVVRTGRPEIYPEVPEHVLEESAQGDPELLGLLREVGFGSVIVVPLSTSEKVVGAVTLVTAESGRRFDDRSLRFAEELAARMGTAIDNARLHHELGVVAGRLERLQAATSRLSRAIGEHEVSSLAVSVGLAAMEADRGFLAIVDGEKPVRIEHVIGPGAIDLGSWMGDDGAGTATLRARRPLLIGSIAEMERRFPTTALGAAGAAWACLPILSDSVEAVLVLAYDRPRVFSPDEHATATSLAEQAGVAIHRARLVAHHRTVAHTLQRGLMPAELPELAGIESDALYEPSGAAEAGGDWYDLFALDDGTVALMVGDTVGHGIPTVATMARIRHVLASYLHDGMTPAEAVSTTNRSALDLVEPSHRFATVAVATIDPSRRRLTMAVAGHPSPVLATPTGARLLQHPRGMALGVDPDATWPEMVVDLPAGSLLLLYTDGWIDHPGADYEHQTESIRLLAEESDRCPKRVLDALRVRFRKRPDRDDAAALAIRVV